MCIFLEGRGQTDRHELDLVEGGGGGGGGRGCSLHPDLKLRREVKGKIH